MVGYKKEIQVLFQQDSIEQHPFIKAIQSGSLTHEQTKRAALHIYHVVKIFPCFIAALLARISETPVRMVLLENVLEEHGNLDENKVHVKMYEQFLLGIGVSQLEMEQSTPSIPIIAYNRAIMDLCTYHSPIEALSALGVVEEINARVSPIIGAFSTDRYSANKEMLVHFTKHETLDVTHANEIYDAVNEYYYDRFKEEAVRGLYLGMYYHQRLYTDILQDIRA